MKNTEIKHVGTWTGMQFHHQGRPAYQTKINGITYYCSKHLTLSNWEITDEYDNIYLSSRPLEGPDALIKRFEIEQGLTAVDFAKETK